MHFITPYPPEECKRLVESGAEHDTPLFSDLRFSSRVLARMGPTGFRLRYRRAFVQNSFAPILDATIEATAGGSRIPVRFRLNRFVSGFMVVWFIGVMGVGGSIMIMSVRALLRGESRVGEASVWLGLLFPIAFLGFGIGLVAFGQFLGRRDRQELISFIEHQLHAVEQRPNAI